MKSLYRLGLPQWIVVLSTVIAVAGGVWWILLQTGVLPAINRFN